MSDRNTFRDYSPNQKYLFPQDVRDWLNSARSKNVMMAAKTVVRRMIRV